MITRTTFDLECTRVIPECGYACSRCTQEIKSTLLCMDGVSKVYVEEGVTEGNLIVEHDPSVATVAHLADALKTLPSFYAGFFAPILITA